ncbi:alpha/beta hydrolase [Nocardioides sp.]|uniref:alpha/beta hydrolase n=1 Tax=Nocardioides sp. TaxID=35761 RepID=UPI0035647DC5
MTTETTWVPDMLGEPYLAETLTLADDHEGAVEATLIHRPGIKPPRTRKALTRAVLHVHGFADYFFQTEYAQWWAERGYDFYALDLRKYGRSLREHQTPNYAGDLREYFAEIDEAWNRIVARDGHDHVVLSAHSTGGLVVGLWANERRPSALSGVVLNSPWTDLTGGALVRAASTPVLNQVGIRQPMREIKRQVVGLYGRSLHHEHDGEWDYNLLWKPMESFKVYAGWLRAIRHGHAELHRGLEIPAPILVLSSDRSSQPTEMNDDVHETDIVLDVGQIRQWATSFGPHVTYVAVPGARHDVVLSLPGPRTQVYDTIEAWRTAFVDPA